MTGIQMSITNDGDEKGCVPLHHFAGNKKKRCLRKGASRQVEAACIDRLPAQSVPAIGRVCERLTKPKQEQQIITA
jgi:hypothetical protein